MTFALLMTRQARRSESLMVPGGAVPTGEPDLERCRRLALRRPGGRDRQADEEADREN